jgi:hypothetical protein
MLVGRSSAMRWGRFSKFDFDDPDNVYLYIEKRGPLYWILLIGGVFGGVLWFMDWAMDPNWNPPYIRGKGAWPIALTAIMPVAVRGIVFACLLALIAECFYRAYYRMYDGHTAFIIGPTGVARLDPWNPCSLGWDEVREIRREMHTDSWGNMRWPLELSFVTAPVAPPAFVPLWLWQSLPARLTDRRIEVTLAALGRDEGQLIWLIRRFAGPVTIVDHPLGLT